MVADQRARRSVDVRWSFKTAFVETCTGLLAGALIWLALLGVRWLFDLDEVDRDLGLVVNRVVRELGARSAIITPEDGEHAAVLVDIDAEEDTGRGARGPCQALAGAFPNDYSLGGTDEPTPARSRAPKPVKLNCSSARPLNRYLLARVIAELDARGAAAIVLDTELRQERDVVDDDENRALVAALAKVKTTTVVFATPVASAHFDARDPFSRNVELADDDRLPVERFPVVLGAVALSEAEQPVRRYSKCYLDTDKGKRLGNVAFVAALVLRGRAVNSMDGVCDAEMAHAAAKGHAELAPRIAYALPSLSLRHITEDATDLGEHEARLRMLYRGVYTRCRAVELLDGLAAQQNICSRADTYAGRVVVVGTSSPLRRDFHQTPLGTMVGAEVVINAIRSFELGLLHDRRGSEEGIFVKGGIELGRSALLWFVYFAVKAFEKRNRHSRRRVGKRLWCAAVGLLFIATLLTTIAMTLWDGYRSLTIVGAVMGMAVEQFVGIVNSLRNRVKGRLESALGLGTFLLVLVVPARAQADARRCPESFLGVRALVAKIEPAGQTFAKQLANGSQETVGLSGVVCVGESVVLPSNGLVRRVELYVGWGIEVVTPKRAFRNEGGVIAAMGQAASFLSQTLGIARDLRAPRRPTATHSRGPEQKGAPVGQVRALAGLKDLPIQRLTSDTAPVIAWRDGKGPYECEARDNRGERTWSAKAGPTDAAWCAFGAELRGAIQLLVIDAAAGRESWDIQRASWPEVPRPEWVGKETRTLSSADRAAWALWLWKEGGREWRLQALGMLNQLAPALWAAGYARDGILNGELHLVPNEKRGR